jgi:hypothetical protein
MEVEVANVVATFYENEGDARDNARGKRVTVANVRANTVFGLTFPDIKAGHAKLFKPVKGQFHVRGGSVVDFTPAN